MRERILVNPRTYFCYWFILYVQREDAIRATIKDKKEGVFVTNSHFLIHKYILKNPCRRQININVYMYMYK